MRRTTPLPPPLPPPPSSSSSKGHGPPSAQRCARRPLQGFVVSMIMCLTLFGSVGNNFPVFEAFLVDTKSVEDPTITPSKRVDKNETTSYATIQPEQGIIVGNTEHENNVTISTKTKSITTGQQNQISTTNQETETNRLLQQSLLYDIPHPDMMCEENDSVHEGKTSWGIDVDEWWTHHPDWRIVSETAQRYCFAKYSEPLGAFFRNMYRDQFLLHGGDDEDDTRNDTTTSEDLNDDDDDDGMDIYRRNRLPASNRNCSNVFRYPQVVSGVGAMLDGQMKALYLAHKSRRPFQFSLRRHTAHWKYVGRPPPPTEQSIKSTQTTATTATETATNQTPSSTSTHHWSWCPTRGLDCFLLPISNCPHVSDPGTIDTLQHVPSMYSPEYRWHVQYLLRFRYKVRWRLRRFMEEHDGHVHNSDHHLARHFIYVEGMLAFRVHRTVDMQAYWNIYARVVYVQTKPSFC